MRLLTRWTVTRPEGTRWSRTFTTEAAAWRAAVGGCNTKRESRARKAAMLRAGWQVQNLCFEAGHTRAGQRQPVNHLFANSSAS